MTLDIKDFYYGTNMTRFEYIKLALNCTTSNFFDQYTLQYLRYNGWVYMDICKGMPGLKQAGRIANDRLKAHLSQFGFAPVPRTLVLWKHATKHITFSLVVDNFGVNYIVKENSAQLFQSLQKLYSISIDWTGPCNAVSPFTGTTSRTPVTLALPTTFALLLSSSNNCHPRDPNTLPTTGLIQPMVLLSNTQPMTNPLHPCRPKPSILFNKL